MTSLVKTPAWRPKRVPFASAIASSSESYGVTVHSGPKTSSHETFASARRVGDDGRPEELAVERPAGQDARASLPCLLDPLEDAVALARRDERTDVGRVVRRIADDERVDRGRKRSRNASYALRST